ncbi:hypothetical protein [Thalassotalea piscium]|uniref:Uncharacterized protein n=1 Tax=Thalassotalea piscium TaxID=1230533 RepID=A0A7X0NI80_9GAMM|nr:hypothetical protein [Thalassotalea piscium]MBB6543972.1 hypothetical protein [Thalassotalea piscium]
MGQINYSCFTNESLSFQKAIVIEHTEIKKVHLNCTNGILNIHLDVENIYAEDDHSHINKLVQNHIAQLTIIHNIPTKEFKICGSSLPYKTEENAGLFKVHKSFQINMNLEGQFNRIDCNDINNVFNTDIKPENIVINTQLAVALSEEEPITKFILLYNVLQQCLGNEQRLVEHHIKQFNPKIKLIKSPFNGRMETIYSSLRNELNHKRNKIEPNLELTKKKVITHLNQFTKITTQIILDQN